MTIRLLAFTDRGEALARTLAKHLDGEAARCGPDCPLSAWTKQAFSQGDALVFVGAAGIAVRAIAPYVKSKASDPAVVVVDEAGKYAIPILSGHLGGANALARRIAACIGGQAILTTATDLNQVFAVDLWAKAQGCAVPEPERIKCVSARRLAGEPVEFESDFPLPEPYPAGLTPGSGAGFTVSIDRKDDERLHLVPRIVTLGVGCKKATTQEAIEAAYRTLLDRSTLHPSSILQVCTIDRKGEEPGLLAFCAAHRRGPVRGPGDLHRLCLRREDRGCGQRLRAGGGAGQRRDAADSQAGSRRRDPGGGFGAVASRLEVAGCLRYSSWASGPASGNT